MKLPDRPSWTALVILAGITGLGTAPKSGAAPRIAEYTGRREG